MLNNLKTALFRFHTADDGILKSESAVIAMLCIYELQFASWFAGNAQVSSLDAPITYLISLTNIFGMFGTTLKVAKLLLITFTVIYAFIVSTHVFGITNLLKKNRSSSAELQKISAILFAIQKYFLLIPALSACSSALGSSDLLWPKIVGGVLLALICINNLLHSLFKVVLPYSKNPLANLTSYEETKDFAIQVLAAFLSTNYVKRYFINTVELNTTGTVSLGISIPFLIICLLRAMKLTLVPLINERKYQTLHIIFSFSSVYILVEMILSGRGVVASFPTLIIASLLLKVILNCRELILIQLFNTLQRSFLKKSVLVQTLALRSLYAYFESIRDQRFDIIKVLEVLLSEPINKETFSSDKSEFIEACESKVKSDLRPQLMKFIERRYSLLILEIDARSSFSVRVAYIQFLSEISGKKSRALQQLFETRHHFGERLSVKRQVIIEAIQKNLTAELEDKLHIREVLDIQGSYRSHVTRAQELVSIRVEILSKLVGIGCDLDVMKKLSVKFTEKGERLVRDLNKVLDSNCGHLETVALFDYIHLCLYEMSLGPRALKLQAAISKVKAFNFSDLDREIHKIPEKSILMNVDAASPLSYVAFSLSTSRLGNVIVWSKNFKTLLGLPDHIDVQKMKMENIFPVTLKEKIQTLMTEEFENGSNFLNNTWTKAFLKKFDGSLLETKILMTVEVLQNDEIALVLYIVKTNNNLNGFLFDETLQLIGFSSSLQKSLAVVTKATEAEIASQLSQQFSNFKQFAPDFDEKSGFGDDNIDFECEFQTWSPEGSSLQKLTDLVKKPQRTDFNQTLFLRGTISKSRFEMFDFGYYTLSINHIAKKLKRITLQTQFLSPTLAHSRTKTTEEGEDGGDSVSPTRTKKTEELKETPTSDGYEQISVHADLAHEESSQMSSSLLDNKRKRMKQLISTIKIPRFLLGINILGHLSVVGLVIMIIVSYVVLSQAYNQFSQFAHVAPFPSYLSAIIHSCYTNVEQAVAVNNGYYPPSEIALMKKSVAASFKDKVQKFLKRFNQYMVNYDVEELSPNFHYDDFAFPLSRAGIYDTPHNISIYEASKIFLGIIYKINKTDFAKFTSTAPDTIWFDDYALKYIDAYENMRATLYSDFQLRYKTILSLFDIILAIGAVVTLTIVGSFAVVLKSTERRKSHMMRQALTIPVQQIHDYLHMCQIEYKAFFGTDIVCKNFQMPTQKGVKENKKKRESRHVSKTVYKTREMGIFVIAIFSLLPILYVMAYYVVASIYFKQKTREAIPFINNIDTLSKITPYPGLTTALYHRYANTYDTFRGNESARALNQAIINYKVLRDSIVQMMQTAPATLLASSYASDNLKERYANISTIQACEGIRTNPNYPTCLTGFNGAARGGFAAMAEKMYTYTYSFVQTLMANTTREIILELFSSPQVKDRLGVGTAMGYNIELNIEVEGANLSGIMNSFQAALKVLLAIGMVQMASVLFLIWRPIYRKIIVEYVNCRRVYAVLPVFLIAENKYILKMLKVQQSSRFC